MYNLNERKTLESICDYSITQEELRDARIDECFYHINKLHRIDVFKYEKEVVSRNFKGFDNAVKDTAEYLKENYGLIVVPYTSITRNSPTSFDDIIRHPVDALLAMDMIPELKNVEYLKDAFKIHFKKLRDSDTLIMFVPSYYFDKYMHNGREENPTPYPVVKQLWAYINMLSSKLNQKKACLLTSFVEDLTGCYYINYINPLDKCEEDYILSSYGIADIMEFRSIYIKALRLRSYSK